MANGDSPNPAIAEDFSQDNAGGLASSPQVSSGPSAFEKLKQIGQAFSGISRQESNAAAWAEYQQKVKESERLDKMFFEAADQGDLSFLGNAKDLQKRYGSILGPGYFERTLPFLQEHARHAQSLQHLATIGTQLGQLQQKGVPVGDTRTVGGQSVNPLASLAGAAAREGMKPEELSKYGVKFESEKTPGDLDARASSHGYPSYKAAPLNVQKQIMHESDTAGRETPAEKGAGAYETEKGRIRADTEAGLTADGSAPSVPIGVSPSPGKLPTMLNYKGFASAHPELPPKQLPAAYKQEQGKYKKEVDDIRLVETAENGSLKAANDILAYMDKHNISGGGALAVPGSLVRGYLKNLTSSEQLTLRDKIGNFRAAAMPSYLAKGGNRSIQYLRDVSSHLPDVADTPQTIRQQTRDFFPFIHNQITAAHQTIAGNFGIDYKEGEVPKLDSAETMNKSLEKYRKPDGTYDLDAIARDPNLK